MKFKKRPYHLFLPAAVLTLVTSLFFKGDMLDVHLHDTYFVVSLSFIYWFFIALLLILWALYFLTSSVSYSFMLVRISTFTSILCVAVLLFLLSKDLQLSPTPLHHYYFGTWERYTLFDINAYFFLTVVLVFLVAQLCFLINVVIGLIRTIKSRS